MQLADQPSVLFPHSRRQEQRAERRRDREGGDQSAGDGIGVGFRHRAKNMALDAAEREQGHECRDDDGGGEKDALAHLGCRMRDEPRFAAQPGRGALAMHDRRLETFPGWLGHPAHDVFHHDHGCIHDQAEIDGADREQVGGLAAQQDQPDRERQREGDGGGHDQRAAQIAQEDVLQDEYQQYAFDQIMHHRMRGDADQVRAVIDAFDMHAGRQNAGGVDLLHQRFHGVDSGQAFRAAAHQHDALHDVVGIVLAGDTQAGQVVHAHFGNIADAQRAIAVLRNHRVADFVHGVDQPDAAHHRGLIPEIDRLTADVDVRVVQRGQHLRQGDAVMQQLGLIDAHFKGFGLAAPTIHVHHARHRLEAAFQHPVFDRFEVGHRIAGRPHHAVAEDFAYGAFRRNAGQRTVRQRRQLGQPVDDTLFGFLIRKCVAELHFDIRQAEQADGANGRDVGNACHLNFDGDRNVTLDLLGTLAGALRHDVHQRRHRVWIGFNIQIDEADDARGENEYHQHGHEHALAQHEGK